MTDSQATIAQEWVDEYVSLRDELRVLREFYEVAKATDRYFVEVAQGRALADACQDYRFYMGRSAENLDIAVQKIEDWLRDRTLAVSSHQSRTETVERGTPKV